MTTWRSRVPVMQSHALPIHPFDFEHPLLTIRNDAPHIPADIAGDAPTLEPGEYRGWLLDTLRTQHSKDKEASKKRTVRWHEVRQDPRHEPEDWADFQPTTYTAICHRLAHRGWRRRCQTGQTPRFSSINSSNTRWPLRCNLLHLWPPQLATKRASLNLRR